MLSCGIIKSQENKIQLKNFKCNFKFHNHSVTYLHKFGFSCIVMLTF